jgi:hypothetical protein
MMEETFVEKFFVYYSRLISQTKKYLILLNNWELLLV